MDKRTFSIEYHVIYNGKQTTQAEKAFYKIIKLVISSASMTSNK